MFCGILEGILLLRLFCQKYSLFSLNITNACEYLALCVSARSQRKIKRLVALPLMGIFDFIAFLYPNKPLQLLKHRVYVKAPLFNFQVSTLFSLTSS